MKLNQSQHKELESLLTDLVENSARFVSSRNLFTIKYTLYLRQGYDIQDIWERYKEINRAIYAKQI